jgi:membrane-bound ClpP family serine protease
MLFFVPAFRILADKLKLIGHLHKSHRQKRLGLPESFISSPAIVDAPLNPQGSILINGELWLARSANETRLESRTKVIVVGVQDHLLLVAER